MSNNVETPTNNRAVFTILQIIKALLSLAAKAEVGALYINCQEVVPSQHIFKFMGHKQPPTSMKTENTTALGVVNSNFMNQINQWTLNTTGSDAKSAKSNLDNTGHRGRHT